MHGQWMTISYVWVMEVNTGATLRTAYLRLVRILLYWHSLFLTFYVLFFSPAPSLAPFMPTLRG